MTRDEIRTFTERFITTWERADVPALAVCYSEQATIDSPMFQKVIGRERIEQSFRELFRAFEKWQFTVDDVVIDTADRERCVVLATAQATHVGDVFGYPGSGRRFTLRTAFTLHFGDGVISSESRLYDFTGLLVQVGVLRAKGA